MEDYKEKYEQALAIIKKYIDTGNAGVITENVIKNAFPELKESEDEKVRKALIGKIKEIADEEYKAYGGDFCAGDYDSDQIIAWLEEQGQQKDTNKVEQKFKDGQWIVWQDKCYKVNYNGCGYELIDQNGLSTSLEYGTVDTSAHLWDVTEHAKDGDVLCYRNEISLYKHDIKNCTKSEIEFGGFVFYCCYDNRRFLTDGLYSLTDKGKNYIHPATKEQYDLLFKKMNEAGYEWDADKKELKKIDDDWVDLGLPSGTLWRCVTEDGLCSYQEAVDRFKSNLPTIEQLEELKSRCQWEWMGNGYNVRGANGNSIFLPAAGYRSCGGDVDSVGTCGYYWSSAPRGSEDAWYLYFNSSEVGMGSDYRCDGQSVRLVKKQKNSETNQKIE